MKNNPYAGQYSPAKTGLSAKVLKEGLKSLKIAQPNKKYTENSYKTGLRKVVEGGEKQ